MNEYSKLGTEFMPTILQESAFTGAFQKIKWAKQHIRNIERTIAAFNEAGPKCLFGNFVSR